MTDDPVNHPQHYARWKIEVADAIEEWQLTWNRGNAIKYIVRAGRKNPATEIEDLRKAVCVLTREIALLEKQQTSALLAE